MKKAKAALLFATILVFALAAIWIPDARPALAAEAALTIKGDGVEKEVSFTLAQLKAMSGSISEQAYTAWNTWPSKYTYYAKGVALADLLKLAGLKAEATTINISEAAPAGGGIGYNMSFLLSDLLGERYTFEGGKSPVPAMLAFKLGERSFATMDDTELRLIYGQLAEQEQTSIGFVKSVGVITVTQAPIRQLPQPDVSAEKLADGRYSVTLTHKNINAKIYYTTDGSTPTANSVMYNKSAPHWQPKLNAPFTVSATTQIKAIAMVTGYADSDVLSFTAESPATQAPTTPATPAAPSSSAPQAQTRPDAPPTQALPPSPTPPASGSDAIKVILNGKTLSLDVPPQIINSRVLVPLRAIFEEMGASIDYDSATSAVTAVKGETTVLLIIGDTSPTINGKVTPVDQPGVIVNGRTLAPLRFVAEAFGGTVVWDGDSRTATITLR